MFLVFLLILLLAGIAVLLWWRAREEREWLLEFTYLNRHQNNKQSTDTEAENAPQQQPARPNVLPQRAQTQVKLHYQKVQDELQRKIELLAGGVKKSCRFSVPPKKKQPPRKLPCWQKLPLMRLLNRLTTLIALIQPKPKPIPPPSRKSTIYPLPMPICR